MGTAGGGAKIGGPDGGPRSAEPGGKDSIAPFKENSHSPSLDFPPNSAPPAITTTYCSPSCSKVVAVEFTPPSVWNAQSRWPVSESIAVSRPSERPTKMSPPAVVSEPEQPPCISRRQAAM